MEQYTTYVCGNIVIDGLSKERKIEIRNHLEDIYPMQEMADIYSDSEITINDEWNSFEDSEKFLSVIYKIAKLLPQSTTARIMCNGENDGDIWIIIIENNRVFTQRMELKPVGDLEEYEKVRFS